MTETAPTVGVAMAAYRAADTIADTLRAMLGQTLPPARIVVAIDGPDPETERVVRTFEPDVECIVLPRNTGGPGGPRNAAVEHLRRTGDVDAYCFFDADDVPHPRFIEVAVGVLTLHPRCPIVFTGFDFWHPPGAMPEETDPSGSTNSWTLEDYLERTGINLIGFSLVRSDACRDVRVGGLPFDESLLRNQDFDLIVRLLAESPGVATTWKGAVYRIHSTSHSASGADAWMSRLLATESLRRHFRRQERPDLVRVMDRLSGSALRRAARHLWSRRGLDDRRVAMRLLCDDVFQKRDLRSLAVMMTLGLGIDAKAASMSSVDHRRVSERPS
ncbi:MAG: glycosyltransferase [Planctomycetota bacterium]|nr:glycosyltransferase [Planctomycetota bacterium]